MYIIYKYFLKEILLVCIIYNNWKNILHKVSYASIFFFVKYNSEKITYLFNEKT